MRAGLRLRRLYLVGFGLQGPSFSGTLILPINFDERYEARAWPVPHITRLSACELPEIDNRVLKVEVSEKFDVLLCAIDCSSNFMKLIKVTKVILSILHVQRQSRGISLAPCPPVTHITDSSVTTRLVNVTQTHYLSKENLENYCPFVDHHGSVRVGGRLENSLLSFSTKHPVIFPEKCNLHNVIVSYYHVLNKHQGRIITHSAIREAGFFIDCCKDFVISFIGKCVSCKHLRGLSKVPKMANLLVDRLHESPCFTYVGLDAFGPYIITDGYSTYQ